MFYQSVFVVRIWLLVFRSRHGGRLTNTEDGLYPCCKFTVEGPLPSRFFWLHSHTPWGHEIVIVWDCSLVGGFGAEQVQEHAPLLGIWKPLQSDAEMCYMMSLSCEGHAQLAGSGQPATENKVRRANNGCTTQNRRKCTTSSLCLLLHASLVCRLSPFHVPCSCVPYCWKMEGPKPPNLWMSNGFCSHSKCGTLLSESSHVRAPRQDDIVCGYFWCTDYKTSTTKISSSLHTKCTTQSNPSVCHELQCPKAQVYGAHPCATRHSGGWICTHPFWWSCCGVWPLQCCRHIWGIL